MLSFKELKFSQDNKYLIIEVAINNLEGLESAVVDYIAIDKNVYTGNGPSESALIYPVADNFYDAETRKYYDKVYAIPPCNCNPVLVALTNDNFCLIESNNGARHTRLQLPLNAIDVDPNKDMVFVYAAAKPDIECPFRIMGTVVNLRNIYNTMLGHIKELEKDCSIPKSFIDDILRLKALETSIKTGNYPLALKYWSKFNARNSWSTSTYNKCKCYGNN